jgi:hypothetical protein
MQAHPGDGGVECGRQTSASDAIPPEVQVDVPHAISGQWLLQRRLTGSAPRRLRSHIVSMSEYNYAQQMVYEQQVAGIASIASIAGSR